MSKQIKMTSPDGVTLYTANKYVEDDIHVTNGLPTYDGANENGEVVERSLKKLLDNTKSCYYLFYQYNINNISDLIQYNDTENVENFGNTFANCQYPKTFPLINTSSGTNFGSMYSGCISAKTFPLINTSSGTKFSYMYNNCSSATEVPQIDTSNGTDFSYMYSSCSSVTSFPQIDTSKGTKFGSMYNGCSKATELPKLNTDLGTNFGSMFYGCNTTSKIDISKFTSSSTSNSNQMFHSCRLLKALIIRSFGDTYALQSGAFTGCCYILGEVYGSINPNGDQDGYIYVPASLLSQYKVATNWATYETQIIGHQDFNVGDTLPSYANDTYTTCTWYSDETLTNVVIF
jgi:hypothetical protein